MQPSLFSTEHAELESQVSGLTYLRDYIAPAEEQALLQNIDSLPWLNDLKRRVQHYGYTYDYKARAVTRDLYLGALPDWLADYADALHRKGGFAQRPDQVIVNEYQPGQGIAPHIDCVPCFAETVASLSLGSACVMDFAPPGGRQKTSMLLEPRSLLVLSDDARYRWTHAIAPRKTDKFDGMVISRNRRVSLTFRKVLIK
jgi:alkylated DNA repair dioxygenase AlkB